MVRHHRATRRGIAQRNRTVLDDIYRHISFAALKMNTLLPP